MNKLVLLRSGHNTWDTEHRYIGWTDVDLSPRGVEQARQAGEYLKNAGYQFDLAFTSMLTRAINTLWIVQDVLHNKWIPVEKDWRLNPRHWGALQGLNKTEIREHYSAERVYQWRRSLSAEPPELSLTDPRHPRSDSRYEGIKPDVLPASESIYTQALRVSKYWQYAIAPWISEGKKVLIVAHDSTLKALIKHLENLHEEDIPNLYIPPGIPLVYEFDNDLNVVTNYYAAELDNVEADCTSELEHSTLYYKEAI